MLGTTALLLAATSLAGCRGDAHAAQTTHSAAGAAPAVAVRVHEPEAGPVSRPIRGTGVVRLKSEADLSFKVGGVVAAVLVEEGATVKKGQVLARLDPTEVDASLRQAREAVIKAERDVERAQRLHAAGAVPIVERQNAETGLELARAGAQAAVFNAQRASVIAPDDGRIDRRMLEPGEVVAPGRPVFHLSGRSKGAVVRLGLGDRDILRVREGDAATVRVDARPDDAIAAKVTQIATVATPGVGTFDVEVKLESPPSGGDVNGLLSGLTAKVEIPHDETVAAVVPLGALVDGKGTDAAVFLVENDRAKKVPVKIAFLLDGRAALARAPFPAQALVVGAGSADLDDGAAVRIVK